MPCTSCIMHVCQFVSAVKAKNAKLGMFDFVSSTPTDQSDVLILSEDNLIYCIILSSRTKKSVQEADLKIIFFWGNTALEKPSTMA